MEEEARRKKKKKKRLRFGCRQDARLSRAAGEYPWQFFSRRSASPSRRANAHTRKCRPRDEIPPISIRRRESQFSRPPVWQRNDGPPKFSRAVHSICASRRLTRFTPAYARFDVDPFCGGDAKRRVTINFTLRFRSESRLLTCDFCCAITRFSFSFYYK